jgi:hypothetical protein
LEHFKFVQKFTEISESQGAPPVSATPAANLPLVSTTPAANFANSFAREQYQAAETLK